MPNWMRPLPLSVAAWGGPEGRAGFFGWPLGKRPAPGPRSARPAGDEIESGEALFRLPLLRETGARTKFLSPEPLLGRLPGVDLARMDRVIAGGESGPGARPTAPDWVRRVRDECRRNGAPFFFEQWGGVFRKRTGRLLDGRTRDEMPPRDAAVGAGASGG